MVPLECLEVGYHHVTPILPGLPLNWPHGPGRRSRTKQVEVAGFPQPHPRLVLCRRLAHANYFNDSRGVVREMLVTAA